jgi:hypothetical protein
MIYLENHPFRDEVSRDFDFGGSHMALLHPTFFLLLNNWPVPDHGHRCGQTSKHSHTEAKVLGYNQHHLHIAKPCCHMSNIPLLSQYSHSKFFANGASVRSLTFCSTIYFESGLSFPILGSSL